MKRNSFALQELLDCGGNIGVLVRGDSRRSLPNRDLAAHTPIELSHLQADVAAADHGQAFGELRTMEPVAGVEELDFVEAGNVGDGSAITGIDDNLSGRYFRFADLQTETGTEKSRVAAKQFRIIRVLES